MKGPLRISVAIVLTIACATIHPRYAGAMPVAHGASLPLTHSVTRTIPVSPAHAPRPGHAPRPARAPHRSPTARTNRHNGPNLVSDLPPSVRPPRLEAARRIRFAHNLREAAIAHAIPDGRGPPRASPITALLIPLCLLLPLFRRTRRTSRLRAARRIPALPAPATNTTRLQYARGSSRISIDDRVRAPPPCLPPAFRPSWIAAIPPHRARPGQAPRFHFARWRNPCLAFESQ